MVLKFKVNYSFNYLIIYIKSFVIEFSMNKKCLEFIREVKFLIVYPYCCLELTVAVILKFILVRNI